MANFVNTIDLLGDEETGAAIIDKTITEFNDDVIDKVGSSAFYKCLSLTSVNLPNVKSLGASCFYGCSVLTIVILRSETLCTLENNGVFSATPLASNGTGGTVYVPQALIEQYKTATNWSALYAGGKCNFVAIEGSEYE